MAKFGLIFFPRNAEEVAGSTRLMDELGYDLLGLVDSHGGRHERKDRRQAQASLMDLGPGAQCHPTRRTR